MAQKGQTEMAIVNRNAIMRKRRICTGSPFFVFVQKDIAADDFRDCREIGKINPVGISFVVHDRSLRQGGFPADNDTAKTPIFAS